MEGKNSVHRNQEALLVAMCDKAIELKMTVGDLITALEFALAVIPHRFLCSAKVD